MNDDNIGHLYFKKYDYPYRPEGALKTYMIATTPRSGSTFFGLELWRNGGLGAPLEYMNLKNIPPIAERLGRGDMARYWDELLRARTSPNGVFGCKTFVQNYGYIAHHHPDLLAKIAPDYVIYLTRRDTVAQAVSYLRAVQTEAWFASVEEHRTPEYSKEDIDLRMQSIERQRARWEAIFELTGTTPLRLVYEDVRADLPGAISQIADFLEIDLSGAQPVSLPLMRVQSDGINREWADRYRSELARDPLPTPAEA